MSIKKCLIILIVVLLSFLISTPVVIAIGDDKYSRPSLKGLRKLSVVVQIEKPVSEDFRKAGLTEDRIRTGAELKLQEAKIDVVYVQDYPRTLQFSMWRSMVQKRPIRHFHFLLKLNYGKRAS
jgi:hypothetical protein